MYSTAITAAAILVAVHTKFPRLTRRATKFFNDFGKPDGFEISMHDRQSAPPPGDWRFSGFIDVKTGEKLDPTSISIAQSTQEIYADFEVEGYIQAANNTLKIGEIDFHFLITDQQQNRKKLIVFFENTRQGGLVCKNNCRGYKRQFHSFNTSPTDKELILEAAQNQYLLKITGRVALMNMTISSRKLQKCHFQGFDDHVTCPVVTIDKIEVMT